MASNMENIYSAINEFHQNSHITTGKRECQLEKDYIDKFLEKIQPFLNIFYCLNHAYENKNHDKVVIIIKVLKRLFESSIGFQIISSEEASDFLVQGLIHPEAAVRIVTIEQIHSHFGFQNVEQNYAHLERNEILNSLLACVGDEDTGVSRHAFQLIFELCSLHEKLEKQLIVLEHLEIWISNREIIKDSTIHFRYVDLIIAICSISDDCFQECHHRKLLEPVLAILDGYDALLKLNLFDSISKLGSCKSGIEFIFHNGVMKSIIACCNDPLLSTISIRLVATFLTSASSFNIQPWMDSTSSSFSIHSFLDILQSGLDSTENLVVIASMDGLASIARTSIDEFKKILSKKILLRSWLEHLPSSKYDLKCACLLSLASVLSAHTRIEAKCIAESIADIWTLNKKLFDEIGKYCMKNDIMDYVIVCLRQPFPEIRIAIYHFLRAIAAQGDKWGIQALSDRAGLIEVLLDRSQDKTKEVKEWKFAVIEAIHLSPFKTVIDKTNLALVAQFLQDGPYLNISTQQQPEMEAA